MSATQTEPNDPPPQEEPTHDVPVYPEQDPPPGRETTIKAAGSPGKKEEEPEPRHADPGQPEDVDEDDLDPKVPHSPPDAGKGGKIVFDENNVPS
jgi:hypothetical protein